MQVVNRIDHLISELTKLKPTLSDDSSSNAKRFNDLLTSSIETKYTVAVEETGVSFPKNATLENKIPSWVDPNYDYDPQNPRKPNMRELMTAMSGKNLEDLYAETDEKWQQISRQASDILHGVVGSNEDTRDWPSIMASKDILTKAREETRTMYEPEVDIQSNFDDDGILAEQIAVIKDNKGNTLHSLTGDITSVEETLVNFGVTNKSIPANLEERTDPEKFDENLLSLLKNFDNKPNAIQQIVLQSATEVIANKLSQEIPLDELAKL